MSTVDYVKTKKKREVRKIPKELVYEMRLGRPVYYRYYNEVLLGEKTLEEVIGSSKLQAWIIMQIVEFLLSNLQKDKYIILSNELGFIFAPKSWRNLDIAIFKKDEIINTIYEDKYSEVPPKVVIEIDTKADLKKFDNPIDYFLQKTDDLLNAGVEKVIWIFTKEKKTWIAERGKKWIIQDWNDSIEIMESLKINLEDHLK
jgi:Uma2 family endonuclease